MERLQRHVFYPPFEFLLGVGRIVWRDPGCQLFRHGAQKHGNSSVVTGHLLSHPVAAHQLALSFELVEYFVSQGDEIGGRAPVGHDAGLDVPGALLDGCDRLSPCGFFEVPLALIGTLRAVGGHERWVGRGRGFRGAVRPGVLRRRVGGRVLRPLARAAASPCVGGVGVGQRHPCGDELGDLALGQAGVFHVLGLRHVSLLTT